MDLLNWDAARFPLLMDAHKNNDTGPLLDSKNGVKSDETGAKSHAAAPGAGTGAAGTCLECILGPGDMLFVPRWWWHFVTAIDESTALQWEQQLRPTSQRKSDNMGLLSQTTHRGHLMSEYQDHDDCGYLPAAAAATIRGDDDQRGDHVVGAEGTCTAATSRTSPALTTENAGAIRCSKSSGVDFSFSVSFWWGRRLLRSTE